MVWIRTLVETEKRGEKKSECSLYFTFYSIFRHTHALDLLRGHSKFLQGFEDIKELPKHRIYQQSLRSFVIGDLFQL